MFVYSVISQASFTEMQEMVNSLSDAGLCKCAAVVGCMADLETDSIFAREVSAGDAAEYSAKRHFLFAETSPKVYIFHIVC